jgi:hypothetical protein
MKQKDFRQSLSALKEVSIDNTGSDLKITILGKA